MYKEHFVCMWMHGNKRMARAQNSGERKKRIIWVAERQPHQKHGSKHLGVWMEEKKMVESESKCVKCVNGFGVRWDMYFCMYAPIYHAISSLFWTIIFAGIRLFFTIPTVVCYVHVVLLEYFRMRLSFVFFSCSWFSCLIISIRFIVSVSEIDLNFPTHTFR